MVNRHSNGFNETDEQEFKEFLISKGFISPSETLNSYLCNFRKIDQNNLDRSHYAYYISTILNHIKQWLEQRGSIKINENTLSHALMRSLNGLNIEGLGVKPLSREDEIDNKHGIFRTDIIGEKDGMTVLIENKVHNANASTLGQIVSYYCAYSAEHLDEKIICVVLADKHSKELYQAAEHFDWLFLANYQQEINAHWL